jgi:hypothetical protein
MHHCTPDGLFAHESIESLLGEAAGANDEELARHCHRSTRGFREGLTVSWEQVKFDNGI